MYTILRLTLLVLLGLALCGCVVVNPGVSLLRGSGNVTTETRAVGAFSAIDVSGAGEVVITQGDADGLTVTTDDNLQAIMQSEVRDDILYLSLKADQGFRNATRLTFTVTVKHLSAIRFSGAGVLSARELSGDQLTIDNAGVGALTTSGTMREQVVTLSGVGNYDGSALVSERASVTVSGIGSATVNASERLDATINGAGSIAYLGSPELHEQVSGLGSVRQRAP